MKIYKAKLRSIAPYSQSRFHSTEKLNKESHEDYEKRTWKNRLHVDENGHVFIPPMAFKNSITEVAQYLGKQIPGQGKRTYTKHFTAGILVVEGLTLPIKKDDVDGEWLPVPPDGQRGGSKRVMKCFPYIPHWEGEVYYHILDETITYDVFVEHLQEAGNFIGLGRFRPIKNGFYGRYKVVNVAVQS